jgi:hypothetical protein
MTGKKKLRVLTVRATDQQYVLGMEWRDEMPGFDKGEVVHASDPRLPLTDRTSKFLTVATESASRADPGVGLIEVHDTAAAFDRKNVPIVWHRGHRLALSFYPGTGSVSQTMPVPAFWEVSLDDQTIGTLRNTIDSGPKLVTEAVALADAFIERRIEEKDSRF